MAVIPADALEGDRLVDRQGQELGRITDLIVDLHHGIVAYAAIACGDAAHAAQRLVAIPWPALRMDADSGCFILDSDRQRLEDAPALPDDGASSVTDPAWATEVHGFFGVKPYWSRSGRGSVVAAGAFGT